MTTSKSFSDRQKLGYVHYTMPRDYCDKYVNTQHYTVLSMCFAPGNREENQLSPASYNQVSKLGIRDGSRGYKKRTRFSKKLFLNHHFTFVHVKTKQSSAHVAGRQGANLQPKLLTATFLLCFVDKGAAAKYQGSKRCTLTGRGTQIHGVAPLLLPVPTTAQISQVTLEA